MSDTPRSGKELLATIQPKLREESTNICLRPDLLAQHDTLARQLAEATVSSKRLAGGPVSTADQRELAQQIADLEAEIEATAVRFTFRALPVHKFRALTDSNPPRKGDEIDQYVGYNRDAVLDAMVRGCMVDPVFDDCRDKDCAHVDCGTWQQFINVCNRDEWTELRDTVNLANRSVVESPKSVLASRILGMPGSGQRQPAPTE